MRFHSDQRTKAGPPGADSPDPDAATLRSLSRLTAGDPSRFAAHTQPSEEIQAWIGQLDLPETNALLIHALRRWHTLGGDR